MKRASDHRPVTDSERELMFRVLAHIEPLPEDQELKHRVRLRLRAKVGAGSKSGRQIVALAVLLLAGAAAAQASPLDVARAVTARAKAWFGSAPGSNQIPATPVLSSNRDLAAPPTRATTQPFGATPTEAVAPIAANASSESARAGRHVATKATRQSPSNRSIAASPLAAPAASSNAVAPGPASAGSRLIVDALRARQAGNWARAAALATAYHQTFPAGPLEEEALMLTLEAAAARGASTRGPAEQYLRSFPNGRYQKWASNLLEKAH